MLAASTLSPRLLRAATSAPHVLLVYASGGWDPTMVFDDKLTSGYVTKETGARQGTTLGGLSYVDHPTRPGVKAFFDAYGDRTAIVNGLSTGGMTGDDALRNMWGLTPPNQVRPVDWLSYYTGSLDPTFDIPHAVIEAPYMPGNYAGVAVRLTKHSIAQRLAAIANADSLGSAGETALSALRGAAFGDATKSVNSESLDGEKMRALHYGFARETLIRSRLQTINTELGPQGSDSDFRRQGKIAVELFANGASLCASIQAGPTNHWDTRTDHYARQSVAFQSLFTDLSSILDHADQRGLSDRLLVIVLSERGRSPRIDANGGKGPWPVTSAMLWGAGIRGGQVIKASDDALRATPVSPLFGSQIADGSSGGVTLKMEHIMSALYLRFGVPYKLAMPNIQPLTPILAGDS